jgi:hypothetical protein
MVRRKQKVFEPPRNTDKAEGPFRSAFIGGPSWFPSNRDGLVMIPNAFGKEVKTRLRTPEVVPAIVGCRGR